MITAKQLEYSYPSTGESVLGGIDLTISPGEVVTVVGPSGAGKTTLLRLLALFHPPDSGSIEYNGEDAWELNESQRLGVRRRIGMVFQEARLFNTTVGRNVEYGLRVRRPWSKRIQETLFNSFRGGKKNGTVQGALEKVGLEDKINQNALSLSGGEAQRVAFARAVAVDPEILMLDEPTSNLDPRNTAVIEEAISEVRNNERGVVVATHDMQQAKRISDRVAVLLKGRIIETGTPDKVFNEPDDDRARRFIRGELVY